MAPIGYKALKIQASRYCTYFGTAKLLLFNHRKKATQLIQEVKAMLVVLCILIFPFAVLSELMKMDDGGGRRGRRR